MDQQNRDKNSGYDDSERGPDEPSTVGATSQLVGGLGLSGGVAALFLLLRLMAVSDWNWKTAGAIADTVDFGDAISLIFGTLLAQPVSTAILATILLPLVVIGFVWPPRGRSRARMLPLLLALPLVAVTFALVWTFHYWWLIASNLAITGALVYLRIGWKHGLVHRVVVFAVGSIGGLTVIASLALATLVDTPWIVQERIDTNDGAVTGYVLDTSSGFVTVLTEEERQVIIVKSDDIAQRTITE